MKSRASCLTLLAALSSAACSAPESVERIEATIVNGEPSDETDDTVVELYAGPSSAREHCSASLIAPNVIVTALHCVAEFDTSVTFSCSASGALTSAPPGGRIGVTRDPATIAVHVGANPDSEPAAIGERVFGSGSDVICRNDIAVVVLDRELDLPLAALRFERPTRRGELVSTVGYGYTGMSGPVQRRVRRDVTVTDVGAQGDLPEDGLAAPNTFVVSEGPCQGDSGGPALSQETGAILGVYSISGARSCTAPGVRNIFTSVTPFEPLIREALDVAGYEPLVEPPEPAAEAGAGGEGGRSSAGAPGIADAGVGAADTGGTGADRAGSGGMGADRGGTAQGGTEPEGRGSGSREDASCACRLGPAPREASGFAGPLALLLAFAVWRRRHV